MGSIAKAMCHSWQKVKYVVWQDQIIRLLMTCDAVFSTCVSACTWLSPREGMDYVVWQDQIIRLSMISDVVFSIRVSACAWLSPFKMGLELHTVLKRLARKNTVQTHIAADQVDKPDSLERRYNRCTVERLESRIWSPMGQNSDRWSFKYRYRASKSLSLTLKEPPGDSRCNNARGVCNLTALVLSINWQAKSTACRKERREAACIIKSVAWKMESLWRKVGVLGLQSKRRGAGRGSLVICMCKNVTTIMNPRTECLNVNI